MIEHNLFGFELFCPVGQFRRYKVSLLAIGMLLQEIWEEEYFQYEEDDEQLDDDNSPQRLADCHRAKTVVVEVKDPV